LLLNAISSTLRLFSAHIRGLIHESDVRWNFFFFPSIALNVWPLFRILMVSSVLTLFQSA
jgi:hypothetical protein